MSLIKENFESVNDANSEDEDLRQWEKSQIIFDEFEEYLRLKGYKDTQIQCQLEYCSNFVMNYFFVYEDELSVLETTGTTIRKFLGNWYIRENEATSLLEMKEILNAILDFFEFALINDFISSEQFENIEQVCNDIAWFENRLKTYNTTSTAELKKWIGEYDYDYI